VPGVAEASVKGQWDFGRKRGAVLVMAHPSSSRIPAQSLLKHLVNLPDLKDKFLVTQTFHCHAYSLYLSGEGEKLIRMEAEVFPIYQTYRQ
jgi:hypothetical protein